MKNITKIIIIVVIVGIIGIGGAVIAVNRSNSKKKANELLGTDYCTTDHSMEIGGTALTNWKCAICGKSQTNPDTNVPKLCGKCANETGRCYQCGKLKK